MSDDPMTPYSTPTWRCGTCRHFVRDAMLDGLYGGDVGVCDRISDYDADLRNINVLAYPSGYEDMGTLQVRAAFGCVLWEKEDDHADS